MNTNQTEVSRRNGAWHQQPTMWIVLGVLAFTVVSSIALLYLAATNPPELIERISVPAKTSANNLNHD